MENHTGQTADARIKTAVFYKGLRAAADIAVLVSLLALLFGLIWEHSARRYLSGFADGIVPLAGSPQVRAEAILAWMKAGPARRSVSPSVNLETRDPEDTVNYNRLLGQCGTASNAFINLAEAGGLEARRLLLLDDNFRAKHVVAEVKVGGQWVVVDPAFRVMLREARGRLLTKEELRRNPAVFAEAIRAIPGYNPAYTYERSAHVRWPFPLRPVLRRVFPGYDEVINWTLILERASLRFTFSAAALFLFSILARFGLAWHMETHFQAPRFRLRDRTLSIAQALFTRPR